MTETAMEFTEFPKIARLTRQCIVTEKIDGTNAQVYVTEDGRVLAGSRNRYVTPDADNYGFAAWVKAHEDELRQGLGVGRHYGEWWGSGIQRGYGLEKGEKRFSLFNTSRWNAETKPACCHVVPVLFEGEFSTEKIDEVLSDLRDLGSAASLGFMRPEGVVIYHTAARLYFKKTLEKDAEHKSQHRAALTTTGA